MGSPVSVSVAELYMDYMGPKPKKDKKPMVVLTNVGTVFLKLKSYLSGQRFDCAF